MGAVNVCWKNLRGRPISSFTLYSDITNKIVPHVIKIARSAAHPEGEALVKEFKSKFSGIAPQVPGAYSAIAETSIAMITDVN